MLKALAIIIDEEFGSPLYADPNPIDMEPDHWNAIRERVVEALEGDCDPDGVEPLGNYLMGWKMMTRNGLCFIAITEDVEAADLESYLKDLVRSYFDEVDDVRRPEKDGVEDVVFDVIPPWDD